MSTHHLYKLVILTGTAHWAHVHGADDLTDVETMMTRHAQHNVDVAQYAIVSTYPVDCDDFVLYYDAHGGEMKHELYVRVTLGEAHEKWSDRHARMLVAATVAADAYPIAKAKAR